MRILVVLMLAFVVDCLAIPKPMESITNIRHIAYLLFAL